MENNECERIHASVKSHAANNDRDYDGVFSSFQGKKRLLFNMICIRHTIISYCMCHCCFRVSNARYTNTREGKHTSKSLQNLAIQLQLLFLLFSFSFSVRQSRITAFPCLYDMRKQRLPLQKNLPREREREKEWVCHVC